MWIILENIIVIGSTNKILFYVRISRKNLITYNPNNVLGNSRRLETKNAQKIIVITFREISTKLNVANIE